VVTGRARRAWARPPDTLFSRLTRRWLKRGVFRSIVELQAHQPLPHGNQCRSQALRLDRSPRSRHCCRAARDPSVRVGALGASAQADGERDIERLSDTDRAPAGKLPNYGRHRPMATPLGSPHL